LVGIFVGSRVIHVGLPEGLHVSIILVGPIEGAFVGDVGDSEDSVGVRVAKVGDLDGGAVGGFVVGALVGLFVVLVGEVEGASVVPSTLGAFVGLLVSLVGVLVGRLVVGDLVGE
jgi:hypothetical protein